MKAREKQHERYQSPDKVNAYLLPSEIATYCPLDKEMLDGSEIIVSRNLI
jgi:predicted ATPase with chaperone activity